jgi:phosphoribosyl-AMP cyclohydrolase / phosphoribosyl-ATP pyrophosphohydrolase
MDLDRLNFSKDGGTVTVVTQDAATGAVLMVARADREALERTVATGEMHYTSRTRGLWRKGATSGNVQRVVSLASDCDGDAVLARVRPAGPACHSGAVTCFGEGANGDALSALALAIAARAATSDANGKSYTRTLLTDRNLRLKKLGEESAELVLACGDGDPGRAVQELADVVYHGLVALHVTGGTLDDVRAALADRAQARPDLQPSTSDEV